MKALAEPVIYLVAYVDSNGKSYFWGKKQKEKEKRDREDISQWLSLRVSPRLSLPFLSGALVWLFLPRNAVGTDQSGPRWQQFCHWQVARLCACVIWVSKENQSLQLRGRKRGRGECNASSNQFPWAPALAARRCQCKAMRIMYKNKGGILLCSFYLSPAKSTWICFSCKNNLSLL